MTELIIPKTPELFDIRKSITYARLTPDYVAHVKGVYLLERAEKRGEMEDCHQFIFPDAANANVEARRVMKEHPPSEFKSGALAYYFNDRGVKEHVGLVTTGGFIISKWGRGHLYKHLPHLVPLSYGYTIRFYAPEV